MTRHPFRWGGLAFGLFFAAVIGQWALWRSDLLNPDQLAYIAAGVLIVLGTIGIVASIAQPKPPTLGPPTPTPAPTPVTPIEEETDDREETDPHDV